MPRYALLPGSPERVPYLADRLSEASVSTDRLARASGLIDGVPVAVVATGMGGPSVAQTVTDLAGQGVDTFLRVGGAGPVSDGVSINDIIIATAAVRHEGSSRAFIPDGWPAIATPEIVHCLLDTVVSTRVRFHCGVVHTKDSFFGEIDPDSSPTGPALREHWRAMQKLGVVASEMESATLFAMGTAHGWRTGSILKINDPDGSLGAPWTGEGDISDLAVASLRALIARDQTR